MVCPSWTFGKSPLVYLFTTDFCCCSLSFSYTNESEILYLTIYCLCPHNVNVSVFNYSTWEQYCCLVTRVKSQFISLVFTISDTYITNVECSFDLRSRHEIRKRIFPFAQNSKAITTHDRWRTQQEIINNDSRECAPTPQYYNDC